MSLLSPGKRCNICGMPLRKRWARWQPCDYCVLPAQTELMDAWLTEHQHCS